MTRNGGERRGLEHSTIDARLADHMTFSADHSASHGDRQMHFHSEAARRMDEKNHQEDDEDCAVDDT
jgi:hypothetical protein